MQPKVARLRHEVARIQPKVARLRHEVARIQPQTSKNATINPNQLPRKIETGSCEVEE